MTDPTIARLEDQITWYDQKSQSAQRGYRSLKFLQLLTTGMIPLLAGRAPAIWPGALGVLLVLLEGIQSLNQYQHNWITYRSTCEELKHEKYLFYAQAGPYDDPSEPMRHKQLAIRVESLVSREHSKWVANIKDGQRQTASPDKR